MDDAHRLWHQALDSYFDPNGFRVALQSCIQTLRSVTFLLQNRKHDIPDFDDWYGKWQDRMRADNVMRWLVEARNQIEKRGDLESHSRVRAQVIASYLDNMPIIDIEAQLFEGVDELFSRVPRAVLEKHIFEHGVLKVERRWVANDLSDHELLEALAYVYGKLSILVDDTHRQLGLPIPVTIEFHGNEMVRTPGGGPADGRLPCMVAGREQLSMMISLKTGKHIQIRKKRPKVTKKQLKKAEKKYGPIEKFTRKKNFKNLGELAQWYFSMARRIFLKDGYHSPMVFLVQGCKPILHVETSFEERSDKYVVMRQVATEVERYSADAVMLIGEVWQAPAKLLSPFEYPVDIPSRTEHLALSVCSRAGESFSLSAEIKRGWRKAKLGETTEIKEFDNWMFEPIREVWRQAAKADHQ